MGATWPSWLGTGGWPSKWRGERSGKQWNPENFIGHGFRYGGLEGVRASSGVGEDGGAINRSRHGRRMNWLKGGDEVRSCSPV